MTAYTVFRVAKLHAAADIQGVYAENARLISTENADPARTPHNVWLRRPAGDDVMAAVMDQIGSATIRKNAVLAVMSVISASPEYFRPDRPERAGEWDQERLAAWRAKMEPWIAKRFPHAASVVLHLDESTPHYQVIDVPMVGKKLSCRSKYGGEARGVTLRRWHDDLAKSVESLEIERGVEGSDAEHVPIRKFYGRLRRPTPTIPPAPKPLPPPTIAERMPIGQAAAARAAAEAEFERKTAARHKAVMDRNEALEAKAAAYDLAEKQRREAVASAKKWEARAKRGEQELSQVKATLKEQSALLREIDLGRVLSQIYGAVLAKDSKESHGSQK
ncbi:MAG: hypothetical protein B7Z74_08325, partial [Deltaproteobacteria bacterium 21-66-5]